jgi:hypothetical protein
MPGEVVSLPSGMSAVSSQIEPNFRSLCILIADDHPIIPKTRTENLGRATPLQRVREAYDGAKAIEEAQRLKPDVVVLNVSRHGRGPQNKDPAPRDSNRNTVFKYRCAFR